MRVPLAAVILVAEGAAAAGDGFDWSALLADMDDFAKGNAIYGARFPNDPPARACFTVKTLPLNAKIEIDAVAYLGD